ncbi:MAG TPA: thiamine pyrophosphate-dependent enzyme [Phycisphaerales bacterium]|nr:thiamine pyrophosphate-dependent enzyme [Phycisphaerales bacterium]|tara:strand:- start:2968 stop:3921 length:954 start_codon:yes stop_codon:yes gene_type:complete
MFGLKQDWSLDVLPRYFTIDDYEAAVPRWCAGCGDHGILSTVQRICRDKQLLPEKTVCVSGIGCSSRFPHYMSTYGFHGLHGRAFPVACGVKSRRPDLDVWVATGDGDCCSIGAGHWVHAVRYNMDMVAMLFDNNVYALTKNQSSPTSNIGQSTNTHPKGAPLPPLNPSTTTLSITNCSFVAQTVDWNPVHMHQTLLAAHAHKGFSFVRIFQRCPIFSEECFAEAVEDPSLVQLIEHENGLEVPESGTRLYKNKVTHDPSNLVQAMAVANQTDVLPIGLLYQNEDMPIYNDYSSVGIHATPEDKMNALNYQLDRFAI